MADPIRILSLKKLNPSCHHLAREMHAQIEDQEVIRIASHSDGPEINRALQEDAWIFTSFQAVLAIEKWINEKNISEKSIFCVGNLTANYFSKRARSVKTEKDARSLSSAILESPVKSAAYFKGDRSLNVVPKNLESSNIDLQTVTVYKTSLLYPRIKNLNEFDILLFFSPSGVESFSKFNSVPPESVVGAMGKTTASHLHHPHVVEASTPTTNQLIKESISYFKEHAQHQE